MRFLKPTLVRALNSFGLELRDRRQDIQALQSYETLPSAGLILEVIGTQGVGKTTLNNALYRHLKDRWFFRSDLRSTGPAEVHQDRIERLHRDVYFRRIAELEASQPDPWKSLMTSRQMSIVICESLLIASNSFPRGFIQDEGLFKNFPQQVLACDMEEARPLWTNRVFVHVRAKDPAFALERHQKRRSDRQKRGMFQHEDALEEVLARIQRDNELFDRICSTAQELGRPVTTVYVEDGLDSNVAQILAFEKTLRR